MGVISIKILTGLYHKLNNLKSTILNSKFQILIRWDSHENGLAGDFVTLEESTERLAALVDAVAVARVYDEHEAEGLGQVVPPDVAHAGAAAQVVHDQLHAAVLELVRLEAHRRRCVFDVTVWSSEEEVAKVKMGQGLTFF